MSYYRIQNFPAVDLLDGAQLSASWNDLGDDDRARPGKSVCRTREQLAEYLAQVGIPFADDWILVELEGDRSDHDDEDAHLGALLVHPTEIVATETIGDGFVHEILAAYDELYPDAA